MLSGLLKRILNKVLNDFVEGEFDVELNLFRGKHAVELHALEVKCGAVNDLAFGQGMPLSLTKAYVGTATLDVPFARLGSQPVRLCIKDVLVVARMTLETEWNEEELIKQLEQAMKSAVEKLVVAAHPKVAESQLELTGAAGYFSNLGVLNRTVTRIIDNIEIKLESVHVRLETPFIPEPIPLASQLLSTSSLKGKSIDAPETTSSKTDCTEKLYHGGLPANWDPMVQDATILDISLSKLTLITTDENWKPHFDDDCDFIVYKLLKVEGLQVLYIRQDQTLDKKLKDKVGVENMAETKIEHVYEIYKSHREHISNIIRPILGPVCLTCRAKLHTALDVGPGEPHRISCQLSISPLSIGLGSAEIATFLTLLSQLSRHATWVKRVSERQRRIYNKQLAERHIEQGRDPKLEYFELCGIRARCSTRQIPIEQKQKELEELAKNENLLLLEKLLPIETIEMIINKAANKAYSTKHFKMRRFDSSFSTVESENISSLTSSPGSPLGATVLTSGAASFENSGFQAEHEGEADQDQHQTRKPSAMDEETTIWLKAAQELEEAFGETSAADSKDPEDEIEIEFQHGELGLTLDQGFQNESAVVTACIPGSQAAKTRLIQQGMVVTAVQGESVMNLRYNDVLKKLETSHRPLKIRFKGSKASVKAASLHLRGSLVNFARVSVAIDSLDLTIYNASSSTGLALCCIRTIGVAAHLNTLAAGAAVGIFDRLSHIVKIEAGLGIAFMDIIDFLHERDVETMHLLSSVPSFSSDGMPLEEEEEEDEDEVEDGGNNGPNDFISNSNDKPFERSWSPSSKLEFFTTQELLENNEWIQHAFLSNAVLWDRRNWEHGKQILENKNSEETALTSSKIISAIRCNSFTKWSKASALAWGRSEPVLLPTAARVREEFSFRMDRFHHLSTSSTKNPFLSLSVKITIPDPLMFKDDGTTRRRSIQRSTTIQVDGTIRNLELCFRTRLVAELMDLGDEITRRTKWINGHASPGNSTESEGGTASTNGASLAYDQVKESSGQTKDSVQTTTRTGYLTIFKLNVLVDTWHLILPKSVVQRDVCYNIERVLVCFGPIHTYSYDQLPAHLRDDERKLDGRPENQKPSNKQIRLRASNIYCDLASVSVAAIQNNKLPKVGPKQSSQDGRKASTSDAVEFFDAMSSRSLHKGSSRSRMMSGDSGSVISNDDGFHDAMSDNDDGGDDDTEVLEEGTSTAQESARRKKINNRMLSQSKRRQVSWKADQGFSTEEKGQEKENYFKKQKSVLADRSRHYTQQDPTPEEPYTTIEFINISLNLLRVSFHAMPLGLYPIDLSCVFRRFELMLSDDRIETVLRLGASLSQIGQDLASIRQNQAAAATITQPQEKPEEVSSHETSRLLKQFHGGTGTFDSIARMQDGLWAIGVRLMGISQEDMEEMGVSVSPELSVELYEEIIDFFGPKLGQQLLTRISASWMVRKSMQTIINQLCAFFYGAHWSKYNRDSLKRMSPSRKKPKPRKKMSHSTSAVATAVFATKVVSGGGENRVTDSPVKGSPRPQQADSVASDNSKLSSIQEDSSSARRRSKSNQGGTKYDGNKVVDVSSLQTIGIKVVLNEVVIYMLGLFSANLNTVKCEAVTSNFTNESCAKISIRRLYLNNNADPEAGALIGPLGTDLDTNSKENLSFSIHLKHTDEEVVGNSASKILEDLLEQQGDIGEIGETVQDIDSRDQAEEAEQEQEPSEEETYDSDDEREEKGKGEEQEFEHVGIEEEEEEEEEGAEKRRSSNLGAEELGLSEQNRTLDQSDKRLTIRENARHLRSHKRVSKMYLGSTSLNLEVLSKSKERARLLQKEIIDSHGIGHETSHENSKSFENKAGLLVWLDENPISLLAKNSQKIRNELESFSSGSRSTSSRILRSSLALGNPITSTETLLQLTKDHSTRLRLKVLGSKSTKVIQEHLDVFKTFSSCMNEATGPLFHPQAPEKNPYPELDVQVELGDLLLNLNESHMLTAIQALEDLSKTLALSVPKFDQGKGDKEQECKEQDTDLEREQEEEEEEDLCGNHQDFVFPQPTLLSAFSVALSLDQIYLRLSANDPHISRPPSRANSFIGAPGRTHSARHSSMIGIRDADLSSSSFGGTIKDTATSVTSKEGSKLTINDVQAEVGLTMSIGYSVKQTCEAAHAQIDGLTLSLSYAKQTISSKRRKAVSRNVQDESNAVSHSLLKPLKGVLGYSLSRNQLDSTKLIRRLEGEMYPARFSLWTSDLTALVQLSANTSSMIECVLEELEASQKRLAVQLAPDLKQKDKVTEEAGAVDPDPLSSSSSSSSPTAASTVPLGETNQSSATKGSDSVGVSRMLRHVTEVEDEGEVDVHVPAEDGSNKPRNEMDNEEEEEEGEEEDEEEGRDQFPVESSDSLASLTLQELNPAQAPSSSAATTFSSSSSAALAELSGLPRQVKISTLSSISIWSNLMGKSMIIADSIPFAKVLTLSLYIDTLLEKAREETRKDVKDVASHPLKFQQLLFALPQALVWLNACQHETCFATMHWSEKTKRISLLDLFDSKHAAADDDRTTLLSPKSFDVDAHVVGGDMDMRKRRGTVDSPRRSNRRLSDASDQADEDGDDVPNLRSEQSIHDQISISLRILQLELVKEVLQTETKLEAFLPVIWFELGNIQMSSESFSAFTDDFVVATLVSAEAKFYNMRIGSWEYLVEPWNKTKLSIHFDGKEEVTSVSIDALSRLNINISEDLLVLALQIQQALDSTIQKFANLSESSKAQSEHLKHVASQGSLLPANPFGTTNESVNMESKSAHTKSIHRNIGKGAKAKQADHWFVNNTGMDVVVYDMFQIGCNHKGKLRVEFRDGWDLPSHNRWRKRPRIRLSLMPFRPPIVTGTLESTTSATSDEESKNFGYQQHHRSGRRSSSKSGIAEKNEEKNEDSDSSSDSSSDEDSHELDVRSGAASRAFIHEFDLEYPGAKTDVVPKLLVEVKDDSDRYMFHSIDLVTHILFPNVSSTEWYPLSSESQGKEHTAEILLKIRFDLYEDENVLQGKSKLHEAHQGRATAIQPFQVSSGATVSLDYGSIPKKHWFKAFNRQGISKLIAKRNFTTLRSVALDFSKGFDFKNNSSPLLLIVPIDDTGEFMLSAKANCDLGEPAQLTNFMDLLDQKKHEKSKMQVVSPYSAFDQENQLDQGVGAQAASEEKQRDDFRVKILATSAMIDRKRRALLLESPLKICNNTGLSLELMICEKGSLDNDASKLNGVYPTLQQIATNSSALSASGNYLSGAGLGVSALYITKESTKWVDGGYPLGIDGNMADAEAMEGAASQETAFRSENVASSYYNKGSDDVGAVPGYDAGTGSDVGEGDEQLKKMRSKKLSRATSSVKRQKLGSWLKWTFPHPRTVCMYRITPPFIKHTVESHAKLTGSSMGSQIDSSKIGIDPSGWILYGKRVADDYDEEFQGQQGNDMTDNFIDGDPENRWEELDCRTNIVFEDNRCAKQFFLPKVDAFESYKIHFFLGPQHSDLEEAIALAEENSMRGPASTARLEMDLAKAACGFGGTLPIAISSIELFEEKSSVKDFDGSDISNGVASRVGSSLAAVFGWDGDESDHSSSSSEEESSDDDSLIGSEKYISTKPNRQASARKKNWECHLCHEINPSQTQECILCGKKRPKQRKRAATVEDREKEIVDQHEIQTIRKRRARGVAYRAHFAAASMVAKTPSQNPLQFTDLILRSLLRVAPLKPNYKLRARQVRLTSDSLIIERPKKTSSDLYHKLTGLRSKGEDSEVASSSLLEKGFNLLELSHTTEISVFQKTKNIMLIIDREAVGGTRKLRGKLSLRKGVLLSMDDKETFRKWYDEIENVIKNLKANNQGQNVEVQPFTGMRDTISPGESMPIPLNFLYSTKKWSLLIKPELEMAGNVQVSWAEIMDNIAINMLNLANVIPDLHCCPCDIPRIEPKKPINQEKVAEDRDQLLLSKFYSYSFSANIQQNQLKSYRVDDDEASNGIQERNLVPRVLVTVKPWAVFRNALPYSLKIRYDFDDESDGATAEREAEESKYDLESKIYSTSDDPNTFIDHTKTKVRTLLPGEDIELCQVSRDAEIQFQIPDLHTGWTAPQCILQRGMVGSDDFGGRKGTRGQELENGTPVTFWQHGSAQNRQNEVVAEAEIGRSQDPFGPLRVVLYSPFWFYNYSDVHLVVQPNKAFLSNETVYDTLLPPNFQSNATDPSQEKVLPFLRDINTKGILVAVALDKGLAGSKKPQKEGENEKEPLKSLFHGLRESVDGKVIQQAANNWLNETESEDLSHDRFLISNWSKSIKVHSSSGEMVWRSFKFIINSFTVVRREIGVEVVTGGSNAYTRSTQVIFRCRYLIVNRIPDTFLHFHQTYTDENEQGLVRDYRLERIQRSKKSSYLKSKSSSKRSVTIPEGENGNDDRNAAALPGDGEENEQDHDEVEHVQDDDESEEDEDDRQSVFEVSTSRVDLLQEVATGFRLDPEHQLVRGRKDMYLEPDETRIRPFHFSGFQKHYLGMKSTFRFEVCDEDGNSLTRFCSPLSAQSENEFSVLLRSVNGSGRESEGARRVRVSIRREGKTTFILFSKDETIAAVPKPFYLVRNTSSLPIELWQDGESRVEKNVVLQPGTSFEFAWDNPQAEPPLINARALWGVTLEQVKSMKPNDIIWESGASATEARKPGSDCVDEEEKQGGKERKEGKEATVRNQGPYDFQGAYQSISQTNSFSIDSVKQFGNLQANNVPLEIGGPTAFLAVESFIDESTKTLEFRNHSIKVDQVKEIQSNLGSARGKGIVGSSADDEKPFEVLLCLTLRASSKFSPSKHYTIVARCGGKSREFQAKVHEGDGDDQIFKFSEKVHFKLSDRPTRIFILVFEAQGNLEKTLLQTYTVPLYHPFWENGHWIHVNGEEFREIEESVTSMLIERRRHVERLLTKGFTTVAEHTQMKWREKIETGEMKQQVLESQQKRLSFFNQQPHGNVALSRPSLRSNSVRTSNSSSTRLIHGQGSTSSRRALGSSSSPSSVTAAAASYSSSSSSSSSSAFLRDKMAGNPSFTRDGAPRGLDGEVGSALSIQRQDTLNASEVWPVVNLNDPTEQQSSLIDPIVYLRKIVAKKKEGDEPANAEEREIAERNAAEKKAQAWIQVRCVQQKDLVQSENRSQAMTNFRFFFTSIGLSLVHAEKKREVCYIAAQRIRFKSEMHASWSGIDMKVGNVQIDNHDPFAAFQVILAPEELVPQYDSDGKRLKYPEADYFAARRNCFSIDTIVRSSPDRFTEIESFDASLAPLKLRIEESFIGNLLAMFSKVYNENGASAVRGDPIVHPPATNATTLAGAKSALSDWVFVYWFKVAMVEIILEANLEGGTRIESQDQLSVLLKQYIPRLSIQELRLKFREFSSSNLFVPYDEFIRRVMMHIQSEVLYGNASKVLAQTNYILNPGPTIKQIVNGFYEVVHQPCSRCNQGFGGVCFGCQLGLTALIANLSSGITGIIFSISTVTVGTIDDFANASRYDAVTRPPGIICGFVGDIAHAISFSSTKISNDLLRDAETISPIRLPRGFTNRGELLVYGPGNVPQRREVLLQAHAASIIRNQWEIHQQTQLRRRLNRLDPSKQENSDSAKKKKPSGGGASGEEDDGALTRFWHKIKGGFDSVFKEITEVRKPEDEKKPDSEDSERVRLLER